MLVFFQFFFLHLSLTHLPDLLTGSYNLPNRIDNHPEPTDNLPEPSDNLQSMNPQIAFHMTDSTDITIFSCPIPTPEITWLLDYLMVLNSASKLWPNHTKPSQWYQISEFWPNLTILTKFQNSNQIFEYWSNFRILNKIHKFDQISQSWVLFYNFDQIS